jgi:hypothetical protein
MPSPDYNFRLLVLRAAFIAFMAVVLLGTAQGR